MFPELSTTCQHHFFVKPALDKSLKFLSKPQSHISLHVKKNQSFRSDLVFFNLYLKLNSGQYYLWSSVWFNKLWGLRKIQFQHWDWELWSWLYGVHCAQETSNIMHQGFESKNKLDTLVWRSISFKLPKALCLNVRQIPLNYLQMQVHYEECETFGSTEQINQECRVTLKGFLII